MANDTLPAGGHSREEQAQLEMSRTAVSTAVARGLAAFFIAAVAIVPAIEMSPMPSAPGAGVWSGLAGTPRQIRGAVADAAARHASWWQRTLAGNRALLNGLSGFETALEDESRLGRALRPPAQQILSGWLGAGNERVYVGRDGWLFFRPDVEYLTGRGFLEGDVLRRRVAKASELTSAPQPDPRPAILDFHRRLAARGIALVIVPAPVKPGVHPDRLSGRAASAEALQNPSFAALLEELRGNGVLVFDPAPVLAQGRRTSAQYLATDTHWRPETMEIVAERLAAFVNQHIPLPPPADQRFTIAEQDVTNAGDTVAMLDLPAGQRRYPPEKVVVSRVLLPDGTPWRSDRAADVLVLGDSFSNIYSLASMGWGDAAGFVEHVSYALGRPVDRIVQNDAGAYATREQLQRGGPERLAGKRVVIWQFAARELASGDWKVIE
jgi:alginate O-acetyltransferase complex protein AlgJ